MDVESDAAAGYTIRIGHGKDLEDGLVANTASLRVGGKQEAKRAFSHPGGAGFPGMLPGHQP